MKQLVLIGVIAVTGCSFNPGGSKDDLGTGGNGDDMSGVDGDLGDQPDLSPVCNPGDSSCTGGMLQVCNADGTGFDTSSCVLGCATTGVDCKELQPTLPAVASDFHYAGLTEPTVNQPLLVFNSDTGEITDGAGGSVRAANATPGTRNVENGIGFHVASGVGIWTFAKLSVPATTTIVFKHATAANGSSTGAAILTAGDLTIAGTIDARGYSDPTMMSTLCSGTIAGPGGTAGGSGPTAATGTGAGGSTSDAMAGGGGGGYGDVGGIGGKHGSSQGTIGAMTGVAAISPLLGGFGGGSSGTGGTTNGGGGGGGGALQLAAEGTITISGGINAGGCGGGAGDANHGGGGGGSGGAILIESPTVTVTATGKLAANGGGGGGGGAADATKGGPGDVTAARAPGGTATGAANGGGGGAGLNPSGNAGDNGNGAGGGGGGVGRVRLNSRSGASLDAASIVSPTASQGTVVIQ